MLNMRKINDMSKNILEYVLSAIIGVIITIVADYFLEIRPNFKIIERNSDKISKNIQDINDKIDDIECKYLNIENQGEKCIVGMSSELSANEVSVYEGNELGLEGGDIIYITNPFGKYTPTIKFVVILIERNGKTDISKADLFVSKEGITKLDIPVKKAKVQGLFNMRIKREDKRKNKMKRSDNADIEIT